MLVADAQVHVWVENSPERPWVGRQPHVEEPLTAEKLLHEMNNAGVDRAVLVPPSWDDNRNDLVLSAAQEHPDRFAAMGRIDLEAPGARERIGNLSDQPGMLGLRCSFNRAPWAHLLTDPDAAWLWDEAEKADIALAVIVTHAQIPLIDRIAERHPALRLALCHFCFPTGKKGEEAFRDFDMLLPIARRPNVMVKASTLPSYALDDYPYRSMHTFVRRVYDAFGPKRMFWGTDLSMLPCTYRQSITMFTEEMPFLSAEDLEWIMGRGLCEWLKWELPRT